MEDPDGPCPASHRRCLERITQAWQTFLEGRSDRLRHGGETEKVAEAIIEDLFTGVLDWSKGYLMYQIGYADIVISHHLAKYLVIEVKRPGTLFPGRRALENAIAQARRYAGEQKNRRPRGSVSSTADRLNSRRSEPTESPARGRH